MSNQPPESQQVGAEAIVQDERPKAALIRWIDHFNLALMTVLALGLGVIACIAIAQVGARYIFRAPLAWSEEVIRFAMIWGVFLGTGVVVRRGMLVAVEAIYIIASPAVAKIIGWVSLTVSSVFWVVLIYFGWAITGRVTGLTSGSMGLPMSLVYAAIPVGAAIALINTIVVAIDPPRPVTTQAAS